MDPGKFLNKLAGLLEQLSEAGGIDSLMRGLSDKSRLFQNALNPSEIVSLDLEELEIVLDSVMPARRRLGPVLAEVNQAQLRQAIKTLLYGKNILEERLTAFVERLLDDVSGLDDRATKKLKRAIRDFAAEMLHFRDPRRYPLMTHWVWDNETSSGAMRELLGDAGAVDNVILGGSPGVYEAGRRWVAEQMKEIGVYREPFFLVDVFLAHVYADYMRSMSAGMGLLKADFGGNSDPMEVVKKLLGIDESRLKGSRVKKSVVR